MLLQLFLYYLYKKITADDFFSGSELRLESGNYHIMDSKENILFSVIIPTYNRAHLIGKAIESVLGQTYPHWELIVVDDGSTDNTREVVAGYDDGRIRYYYKKNEERSIARNYGIDRAEGLYIGFLDDDDYYLPDFLMELNKKIIEEKYLEAVFMCNEYTEINGKRIKIAAYKNLDENPIRTLWKAQSSIRPMLINRNILALNRFDERFRFGQDFHLLMRIVQKYPVVCHNMYLCVYVIHSDTGSNTKFTKDIRSNAINSIDCIKDLIDNYPKISSNVPQNELYDQVNHKIYGFASAAMKKYKFDLFRELFMEFSKVGTKQKTFYYIISLLARLPLYLIKSQFK